MSIKTPFLLSLLLVFSFSFLQAQTQTDSIIITQNNTDIQVVKQVPDGLFNVTTIGVLSGSSQNRQVAPFSFQSLMLYQFDEHIAAGLGLGVDFLEETYLPLVVDFRYYLRGTRFSPFVFAQTGYSIPTDKSASQDIINDHYNIWQGYPQSEDVEPRGGFQMNPGFGIRHMFHREFGLEISFSYRYQRLNYQYNSSTRLEMDYTRLNIRIGILFQ